MATLTPPLAQQQQISTLPYYRCTLQGSRNASDHVEYCLVVAHRSGLRWQTWRRFSDFVRFHEELSGEISDELFAWLPTPPRRAWIPNFARGAEFLEQRLAELKAYVDAMMANSEIMRMPALQELLGVAPPEQPAGVRVVPRGEEHELEIRPGVDIRDHAPVDAYHIEIIRLDTDSKHSFSRDVGNTGRQPQCARIGRLVPGRHQFNVSAENAAGTSSPVSVTIDTALLQPRAAAELAGRTESDGASLGADPHAAGREAAAREEAARVLRLREEQQLPQRLPQQQPLQQPAPSPPVLSYPLPLSSHTYRVAAADGGAHVRLASAVPVPALPVAFPTPYRGGLGVASPVGPVAVVGGYGGLRSALGVVRGALPGDSSSSSPSPGTSPGLVGPAAGHHRVLQTLGSRTSAPTATACGGRGFGPVEAPVPPSRHHHHHLHQEHQAQFAEERLVQVLAAQRAGVAAVAAADVQRRHLAAAGVASAHGAGQGQSSGAGRGPAPAAAVGGEDADLDDDALCVVCLSHRKTHAFFPCGHRCVCSECSAQILHRPNQGHCPVCRARAAGAIQIFT